MDNPTVQQSVFFLLNFGIILGTLYFYAIFGWVVGNWLIMFGIINPMNRVFQFLTQLVMPLLKPFRWMKIGMLDLSPIAVILLLDIALRTMGGWLGQMV